MRKIALVLGAALALSGCVNPQEKLAQQERQVIVAKCASSLRALDRTVLSKLALASKNRTPDMMADESFPNEKERADLRALVGAEQSCQSDLMHWTTQYRTVYSATQGKHYVALDNVLLDLMVGKITFGEANRRLSTIDIQYTADAADTGLKEQQRQEREADLKGISAAIEDNATAIRSIPAPEAPSPSPRQCQSVLSRNMITTQCN